MWSTNSWLNSTIPWSQKNINRTRWWLHNWLFIRFCLFWKKYRLIAADLGKQKTLDADSRAVQQIIFAGKIKAEVANVRTIIYYILEESKETTLRFSIGTAKVLWIVKMVEYSKVNVKLTDTQLKKLKTTIKNKTGTTLRMSLKIFDANDLSHELLS